MPYIKPEHRNPIIHQGDSGHPFRFLIDVAEVRTTGDLNFLISRLATKYIENKGKSYQTMSEVRAALHDAADEFYRRVVAPYEDQKAKQNGDVYEEIL